MNARDQLAAQTTPARDELLELLRDAELPNTYYHQGDGQGTPAIRPATCSEAAEMALDVVEAAGWSKPRTVNSASQSAAEFAEHAGLPATVLFTPRRGRKSTAPHPAADRWMLDERLREQCLRPMSEVMGEVLKDADSAFELKSPTPPIPYDEMRRLCGLPDVRGYVASRELARMGKQLGDVFQRIAEAWTEGVNKALPGLQAFADSSKPKQAPPMWAVDPSDSPRTRNRATDIRTPYR